MKLVCIVLPFILLIAACANHKKNVTTSDVEKHYEAYPPAVIGKFQKINAPCQIKELTLKRNLLEIDVTYGGGCAEHQFELIGSEKLEEGSPKVRKVQLVHKNGGDQCKALKREKLTFSISQLAEHLEPGNEVLLDFVGHDKKIRFSYQN
ncbi:MAG: hypothetical protein EP338_04825 [Bacteroidetes bacterium]|nr:MAG: hypothetical protein EP338_04825 [Bacteroidota bacterium]